MLRVLSAKILRQGFDNLDRFYTDANHTADEIDNIFGIILSIRVGFDAASFIYFYLILVYNPIKCGAVAETIFKGLGGDAVQG